MKPIESYIEEFFDEKLLNQLSDFSTTVTDHDGECCSIYSEQFETALIPLQSHLTSALKARDEEWRKMIEGMKINKHEKWSKEVDEFFEYQSAGYGGGKNGLRCSVCDHKYSGDANIIQLCPRCKVSQTINSLLTTLLEKSKEK